MTLLIPNPRLLLIALAALALTAAAPLKQGDPIPGRDVVLDGDEGFLTVSGTTDRSGVVLLSPQPGRYALMLPNAQTLRVPAVARIQVGRMALDTNTIQPGGRGNVYFTGRDGRRLSVMVARGERVRIVLTEGAPLATGGGSAGRPMDGGYHDGESGRAPASGGGSAGGTTRGGTLPPVVIVNDDGELVVRGLRTDAPGGPSGPVRQLPDLPAQSATGTNPEGREGVRTDPRIPPPTPRAS